MIQYPIEFQCETTSGCGTQGTWTSLSQEHPSLCSVPVEFMGSGGGLSPEDLFNQALSNCFVATFKVYAENSKLDFEKLNATSRLIVDLDEQRKPVMKSFFMHIKIHKPKNAERALLLAQKAASSGFILNSVKTEKHFNFEILP